jgi:hypothetical protein
MTLPYQCDCIAVPVIQTKRHATQVRTNRTPPPWDTLVEATRTGDLDMHARARPSLYEQLEALPEGLTGEILDGQNYTPLPSCCRITLWLAVGCRTWATK